MNIGLFAVTCSDTTPNGALINTSCLPQPAATTDTLQTVLSIVFGITASIALLIIVIAGFRYIIANGDPESVSRAKKAILYAVIGLLVSLAALSIVTFVIKGVS
jgi:hypothetical protein